MESEVIAQAGLPGSVTISTNMAGEWMGRGREERQQVGE